MTSKQYWEHKFGEPPKTDADKLACAMMAEYHRHERNSYALHIAQKAVEEEVNEQILQNGLRPEIIRNAVHEVLTSLPLNILSRIEKLTEES